MTLVGLRINENSHEITDLGAIELSKGLKRCRFLKKLRLAFIRFLFRFIGF